MTVPYEVRLDHVIKLDKPGDFVGREALRKLVADGTSRLLTTLRIGGDDIPEYGAAVSLEGREVGVVAAPARAPPSRR